MKLHSSRNYLYQIILWFWRGKYHVLTLSAMIVTILYIFGILSFYPNSVSAFLSLTGLFIILVQQFLDAREFVDQKPNTPRRWILSFPTRKPIEVSLEGVAFVSVSGIKANATVSVSENATIEKKIDFLLCQYNHIQTTIGKVADQINDIAASLTNKSKELNTDFDNLKTSTKTTIAGHIVGAYDINLFGIIITICGTLIQIFCL